MTGLINSAKSEELNLRFLMAFTGLAIEKQPTRNIKNALFVLLTLAEYAGQEGKKQVAEFALWIEGSSLVNHHDWLQAAIYLYVNNSQALEECHSAWLTKVMLSAFNNSMSAETDIFLDTHNQYLWNLIDSMFNSLYLDK